MANIKLEWADSPDDPIYNEDFMISSHRTESKKTDGVPKLEVPEDLQDLEVDPADAFRISANKSGHKK
jgi:hypothetical protein